MNESIFGGSLGQKSTESTQDRKEDSRDKTKIQKVEKKQGTSTFEHLFPTKFTISQDLYNNKCSKSHANAVFLKIDSH